MYILHDTYCSHWPIYKYWCDKFPGLGESLSFLQTNLSIFLNNKICAIHSFLFFVSVSRKHKVKFCFFQQRFPGKNYFSLLITWFLSLFVLFCFLLQFEVYRNFVLDTNELNQIYFINW